MFSGGSLSVSPCCPFNNHGKGATQRQQPTKRRSTLNHSDAPQLIGVPPLACRYANAIYSSVNLDFFIESASMPENKFSPNSSRFRWIRIRDEAHPDLSP